MINCPYCGKLTDPRLNACPHCHAPMRRGAGQAPEEPVVFAPPPTAARGGACPNCKAPVKPGDIICVRCGTNLLTGQQVINQAPAVAAAPVDRGRLVRLAAVILLLLIVGGGVGAAYYTLVYNEPVTKAKRLAAQGNLLEATHTLEVFTQQRKDNPEAFELLGRLEYKSSQFPQAASAFDAAAKLKPQDADLSYLAAVAATKLPGGGLNEQIAAFRRIVENHPDDLEAAYLLALALGAAGQPGEEAEQLEKVASSTSPKSADAQRYLGIAKALAGDPAGGEALVEQSADGPDKALARGLLANLRGDVEAAIPDLRGGLQGSSPSLQALAGTQLGLLLLSQGKSDEAMAVLRDASTAPNAPRAASFFYALCLKNAGLETEALTEFQKLAQGSSDDFAADAAVELAQIFTAQDNVTKAEEALRQASAGGKKSARIHTLQGMLSMKSGDANQAQQSFRMALQIDPNYAPAHLELGLAHITAQRLTEGVAELKKYLDLVGDSKDARAPEIKLLVAQLERAIEKAGGAPQAAMQTAPSKKEFAS